VQTGRPDWTWQSEFDGEDTGCGILLMNLAMHFRGLPGGTLVLVTARDPAAPEEMAAWCRMTDRTLLDSRHPYYLIRTR
jgi:tRNA 2-thiouridine synthesizing protein A